MARLFCCIGLMLVLVNGIHASPSDSETSADDEEIYVLQDFDVVAERFGEVGEFSLVSIQVLEEGELQRQVQATLGETLAWQPGLNASYFGPGASRPVIRGLGDYRVRMLVNDIGTLDVSDNSPDHGVPLEPLLIRRVDVHRGPDALLFGNSAIGGAINSQTRYLPENLPDAPISGSTEARYETAASSLSSAAYATARVGDFALRVTAAHREADDYRISGRARSDDYERLNAPTVRNPNTLIDEPVENPSSRVPNTHLETNTYSIGALWEPDASGARIGLAYSSYESDYGVPYQFGGDSTELFGDTSLNMWQSRFDLDASYDVEMNLLERLRFRYGYADYGHEESFDGRAKDSDKAFVDTIMGLDSQEARFDLYHRFTDNLEGVVGTHGFSRDLEVSGLLGPRDNPFRIPYFFETQNLGFFAVETLVWNRWTFRGGYRYEWQEIRNLSNQVNFRGDVLEAKEDSHSLAFGGTWRDYELWIFDELAVTLNLSRIERLPSETERYASWSNPAILRFIIGADNTGEALEVERSFAFEIGLEAHRGDWSGRINLYRYDFEDFVFLQDQKGFGNLAQYVARDAIFEGGEAELTWRVFDRVTDSLSIKWMLDFVDGENTTDDTYLPRIPPLRVGSRIEYELGNFELGADLRYAFKQNQVQAETASATQELDTDDYFELNFDVQNTWVMAEGDLTVFGRVENALDAERRSAPSFLKDVASLPGRNFSFGMRWSF